MDFNQRAVGLNKRRNKIKRESDEERNQRESEMKGEIVKLKQKRIYYLPNVKISSESFLCTTPSSVGLRLSCKKYMYSKIGKVRTPWYIQTSMD